MGIGALVSDSAAVQRHDRVREPGGGGGVRRRPQRARRLSALRRTARALRPRRQGQQAGRQADAARPQAARTRARAGDAAAAAAARRGRRRPDRARMHGAGRSDPKTCVAAASRSSGSSMSCMRCSRWSTGCWCCTAAASSREGDPKTVIKSAAGREIYMGIARRCLSRCSTCGRSTPSTATSRRCSAFRCASHAGEVVAVIGANGAGKSTLLKCIAGAIRSRRDAILFDGEPIGDAACACGGRARHRAGAGRAPAVRLALGRGKPADRRPGRPAGTVEAGADLRPVPGAGGAAPAAEHRRCRAASSRWSPSAAR